MEKRTEPLMKLVEQIRSTSWYHALSSSLDSNHHTSIKTLHGSLGAVTIATLWLEKPRPFLIVTSPEHVDNWRHDFRLFGLQGFVCTPARKRTLQSPLGELVEAFDALSSYVQTQDGALVTSPHSWAMTLPPPEWFHQNTLSLTVGDELPFDEFRQLLQLGGYQRSDFVAEPGEISVRGGILDLYPLGCSVPLRFEFWGDRIESIRQFDPLSQRSIRSIAHATILTAYPRDESILTAQLSDFISNGTLVVFDHPDDIERYFHELAIEHHAIDQHHRLNINPLGRADITVVSSPQPSFQSSIAHFYQSLTELAQSNTMVVLCADSRIHLDRLMSLLRSIAEQREHNEQPPLDQIQWSLLALSEGFILPRDRIALITEHQIFERQRTQTAPTRSRAALTLRQLQQLRRGDYLVHIDKGICQFDGLETIDISGHKQECIRLLFADGDVMYLHLNYVNKLERYSAIEGTPPTLSKLGTHEWERKKARIKRKIKDIARDLIKLYAQRKRTPGFAYPADTVWQTEFEASFMYEDTPDQARATAEVKRDMESPTPMDRLICGDVGFGKTEIAIRAAFKAVQAGKQVAVLVPTTVLARQHYITFTERLARYPVRIEMLSRLLSSQQQRDILRHLAAGHVDIIIGTHRLLSSDVQFRDLGLLIIDEEQRFGVAAKEKLRQMRVNVDTLTLTATPIPRTLHFSLMGARDLSIIETPPRNRLPIETEIVEWDAALLRQAITRELEREGQVFVVNDTIETLPALQQRLLQIIPTLRIGVVHGQLPPSELEKTMERFLERRYNILLATKIIENGLDIPNVNTIIINNADRFGLAELYQLRGRVGRSNRQAYCYLVVESLRSLTRKALQRLQAIEEFTELGSGFNLALRDMEIRGVGNVFGAEQSGFINELGFETYHRILDEAVRELHVEEFSDIFTDQPVHFVNESISIELSTDALLPATYVPLDTERFEWYKQLYRATELEQVDRIADELRDRYGPLPVEASNLLFGVQLRILGSQLGLDRIRIEGSLMSCELPRSAPAEYNQHVFPALVAAAAELNRARVRQVGKVAIIDIPVASEHQSLEILAQLVEATKQLSSYQTSPIPQK